MRASCRLPGIEQIQRNDHDAIPTSNHESFWHMSSRPHHNHARTTRFRPVRDLDPDRTLHIAISILPVLPNHLRVLPAYLTAYACLLQSNGRLHAGDIPSIGRTRLYIIRRPLPLSYRNHRRS